MSFSLTAAQQRDRQTRLSNPLFAWGVAGSLAFHAGILPAILLLAQRDEPPTPAQIEIVVTDSIEQEPEIEPETAVLDEATVDETSTPLPTAEPIVESPSPTVEPPTDLPDTVPETTQDDVAETLETEAEPDVADPQPDRQLDDLLAAMQQRRRSRTHSQTAQSGNLPSESQSAAGEPSEQPDRVAARSEPSGSDSAPSRPRTVACRSCPKPSYPQSALNAGAEGTVNIMVDINANGNVTSASLVGSSGHSALDQAALSAVRNRWRFQPIQGGASGIVVSVVMTIQGSDLNRRASEQGDRQSVEIPSSDIANEEEGDNSTASTSSDDASSDDASSEESPNATSNPQSNEAAQNEEATQSDETQADSEMDTIPPSTTESSSPEPVAEPAAAPEAPPEPAPAPEPAPVQETPSAPIIQPNAAPSPINDESPEPVPDPTPSSEE